MVEVFAVITTVVKGKGNHLKLKLYVVAQATNLITKRCFFWSTSFLSRDL